MRKLITGAATAALLFTGCGGMLAPSQPNPSPQLTVRDVLLAPAPGPDAPTNDARLLFIKSASAIGVVACSVAADELDALGEVVLIAALIEVRNALVGDPITVGEAAVVLNRIDDPHFRVAATLLVSEITMALSRAQFLPEGSTALTALDQLVGACQLALQLGSEEV